MIAASDRPRRRRARLPGLDRARPALARDRRLPAQDRRAGHRRRAAAGASPTTGARSPPATTRARCCAPSTPTLRERLTARDPARRRRGRGGPREQTVGFWIRRMAQETAVHRWDAESAVSGVDGATPDPRRPRDRRRRRAARLARLGVGRPAAARGRRPDGARLDRRPRLDPHVPADPRHRRRAGAPTAVGTRRRRAVGPAPPRVGAAGRPRSRHAGRHRPRCGCCASGSSWLAT